MKKIGVIADLCVDVLIKGKVKPEFGQAEQFVDDYTIELGGSATIFASQIIKLGGKIDFFCEIGNDFFGEYLKKRLRDVGLSDKWLYENKNVKTTLGLGISYYEDRAMLTYKGTMNEITPVKIEKSNFLNNLSHLHIVSYYLLNKELHKYWEEKLPFLKKNGITVSLDTNWSPDEKWDEVHKILKYVDVFIPNEQEALKISGKKDIMEAGEWLNKFCKIVVIKCGEKGAIYFENGIKKSYKIPEKLLKNLKIADTTGAGDNFDAGFIFSWLNKKNIDECIELGILCGTSSLSSIGGIIGQIKL